MIQAHLSRILCVIRDWKLFSSIRHLVSRASMSFYHFNGRQRFNQFSLVILLLFRWSTVAFVVGQWWWCMIAHRIAWRNFMSHELSLQVGNQMASAQSHVKWCAIVHPYIAGPSWTWISFFPGLRFRLLKVMIVAHSSSQSFGFCSYLSTFFSATTQCKFQFWPQ